MRYGGDGGAGGGVGSHLPDSVNDLVALLAFEVDGARGFQLEAVAIIDAIGERAVELFHH